MLGLGGSVGTPTGRDHRAGAGGELASRSWSGAKAEARGKIVLFDVPFTDYGATRRYRTDGPSAAARAGAVACLIRSVASFSIRSPHTGGDPVRLDRGPDPGGGAERRGRHDAAAVPGRAASRSVVTLRMGARTLPDAPSRNVVAEIVGREKPDEVVVLGGHIDSWDVGQGAMDDAGGSVAAWEAVRLMQQLGLRPRRTVRVVLWTNEENGVDGGRGLPRRARGRARAGTCWRWSRTAGCSARAASCSSDRLRGRRWCRRSPACCWPIERRRVASASPGQSRGGHRAAGGGGRARDGARRGRLALLLVSPQPRAIPSTSSIPASWRAAWPRMAVMAYVVADLPEGLPRLSQGSRPAGPKPPLGSALRVAPEGTPRAAARP